MRKSFAALVKPASSACNMRCRYCFYADVSRSRAVQNYGLMTPDTLEALVKKAFDYADGQVAFTFQGGEPTLAGLSFYRTLIELEKRCNTRRVPVRHAIQTNGLLLDGEWADFLRDNNFLTGLSMDGCRVRHDGARVDAQGEGTFSRVCDAADLLKKHGADFNILCVVTGPIARDGAKAYTYLRGRGFRHLQFIPCLDSFGGETTPYSLNARDYARFLCDTFSAYYDDFMAGRFTSVRLFDNYVQMLMGLPPESCGMAGQCAPYFTVEGDGSVYPCDFYVLDEWKMGNIRTDAVEDMIRGEVAARFVQSSLPAHEKCLSCRWRPLCRGGCRRNREPFESGRPGLNAYCEAFSAFFEYAYEKMCGMARIAARNQSR